VGRSETAAGALPAPWVYLDGAWVMTTAGATVRISKIRVGWALSVELNNACKDREVGDLADAARVGVSIAIGMLARSITSLSGAL